MSCLFDDITIVYAHYARCQINADVRALSHDIKNILYISLYAYRDYTDFIEC